MRCNARNDRNYPLHLRSCHFSPSAREGGIACHIEVLQETEITLKTNKRKQNLACGFEISNAIYAKKHSQ
ncbi:hypothetical protein [Helicobacter sp. T3_23-1056]